MTEVKGSMQTNFGISVVISVSKGEEIAKKTDNPRLGILGGISILGTTGIVIPYSTSSFASIDPTINRRIVCYEIILCRCPDDGR